MLDVYSRVWGPAAPRVPGRGVVHAGVRAGIPTPCGGHPGLLRPSNQSHAAVVP